jgi:hypothetical protein
LVEGQDLKAEGLELSFDGRLATAEVGWAKWPLLGELVLVGDPDDGFGVVELPVADEEVAACLAEVVGGEKRWSAELVEFLDGLDDCRLARNVGKAHLYLLSIGAVAQFFTICVRAPDSNLVLSAWLARSTTRSTFYLVLPAPTLTVDPS